MRQTGRTVRGRGGRHAGRRLQEGRAAAGAARAGSRGREGRAEASADVVPSSPARCSPIAGSRCARGSTASSRRARSPRARRSSRARCSTASIRSGPRPRTGARWPATQNAQAHRSTGSSRCSRQNAVAQQDVDNARAELEAAQGDLAEAKKNLDDAVVRAEIGGRVGRTNLEVGAPGDRSGRPAHHHRRARSGVRQLPALGAAAARAGSRTRDARKLIQPGSPLSVRGRRCPTARAAAHRAARLRGAVARRGHRHAGVPRDLRESAIACSCRASSCGCGSTASPATARSPFRSARCSRRSGGSSSTSSARATPSPRATSSPARGAATSGSSTRASTPGDRVVVDGTQKAAPGRPVQPVPLADSAAAGTASPRRSWERTR